MKHTVSIFITLALIWLANSGHYTGLLLVLGLVSVIFIVWVARRMNVVDHESQPLHLSARLFAYYGWLIWQIVQSNMDVVVRIWRGNRSISPCAGNIRLSQKTDMGKVIYANSITLTPGTVAIDLNDDSVYVHSLTRKNLEALEAGDMDNRVTQLEK